MQHPCDKTHALFVWQPSTADSCKKMARRRRESNVIRSARRRHFTGSHQRAPKKNAGAATFLVKVKAHPEEPAHEEADIQADKAIWSKDVLTEWRDRHSTNQAVYTRQEPRRKEGAVSCENQISTWSSGVRKAIRWGSAEEEVRKHQDHVTLRSLETNQQTKTTSRCKLWPKHGNGSMALYMDGWREFQKDLCQGEGKKGRHPPAFVWHMGSRLHAGTGYRKVCAGEVFEQQKMFMETKETFGDGGGRNYANSQCSNQNRQDANFTFFGKHCECIAQKCTHLERPPPLNSHSSPVTYYCWVTVTHPALTPKIHSKMLFGHGVSNQSRLGWESTQMPTASKCYPLGHTVVESGPFVRTGLGLKEIKWRLFLQLLANEKERWVFLRLRNNRISSFSPSWKKQMVKQTSFWVQLVPWKVRLEMLN